MERELVRAGQPAERINTPTIHDYIVGPGADVTAHVCDPMPLAEARERPPEQPDRRVEFLIGSALVRAPLRFLNARIWIDAPLEPEMADPLRLYFPWPELFVAPGSYTPCEADGSGVGCTDEIVVELHPRAPERAASAPGGSRRGSPPVARTEVGVIEGLRFFTHRPETAAIEGPFEGRDAAGQRVIGTCARRQERSPGEASSLSGVRFLLQGGRCRFEDVRVGPALYATIRFPAQRLPEWRAIYDKIVGLLEDFVI